MNSTCGLVTLTPTMARRDFWPPLSATAGTSWKAVPIPDLSSSVRRARVWASDLSPASWLCTYSSGVMVRSIWSAWCWFTSASFAPRLIRTLPRVGWRPPSISFIRVVFPFPFSPTSTCRAWVSTMNSCGKLPTPLKSSFPPGYAKATSISCTAASSSSPLERSSSGRSLSSRSAFSSSASSSASRSSFSIWVLRPELAVLPAAAWPDAM
mmetsp:Transcript_94506/g.246125  ORF Transcript_94506/g.246125 Transcript_94506/m.246125 type:complete len:210 (-) Transcript_94506:195-824(-)